MRMLSRIAAVVVVGVVALATPGEVYAYGGPGSIVSGIGALLAAVVAIAAAVVGFFWFPLKRLVRKLRGGGEDDGGEMVEAP